MLNLSVLDNLSVEERKEQLDMCRDLFYRDLLTAEEWFKIMDYYYCELGGK